MRTGVASTKDCAILCKDEGLSVCTYYPKNKKCMLGSETGSDKPKVGAYYLKKVDDQDVWDDDDDEWEDDGDCEVEKADLDAKLAQCEKDKTAAITMKNNRAVCKLSSLIFSAELLATD